MPDIEIECEDGKTKITNLPVSKVKKLKDDLGSEYSWPYAKRKGDARIEFNKVKKIDTLRPDGSPDQTIWGESDD